jgi:hypothetical protein
MAAQDSEGTGGLEVIQNEEPLFIHPLEIAHRAAFLYPFYLALANAFLLNFRIGLFKDRIAFGELRLAHSNQGSDSTFTGFFHELFKNHGMTLFDCCC